jgi:hypothetical protein
MTDYPSDGPIITHFSSRHSVDSKVHFFEVNLIFRPRNKGDYLDSMCKRASREYVEDYYCGKVSEEPEIDFKAEKMWRMQDTFINYIEKFDCYQLHEFVSDSQVTRAILREIKQYQYYGEFPTRYRSTDACVFYQHIQSLFSYWD